jgi:Raf kinase inhibitor-like YbhB/YbcL family protein
MRRFLYIGSIISAGVFLSGCATGETKLAYAHASTGGLESISLTSPAFKFGKPIPKIYTVDGQNISPPLAWNRAPDPTQQYVLIMEDPDASRDEPFIHWIVYDLSASTVSLPEGISPPGARGTSSGQHWIEGANSTGKIGYIGPKPPPGKPHRYFFELFAIDTPLNLAPGETKKEILNAIEDHVIAKGILMGTYQRQQ